MDDTVVSQDIGLNDMGSLVARNISELDRATRDINGEVRSSLGSNVNGRGQVGQVGAEVKTFDDVVSKDVGQLRGVVLAECVRAEGAIVGCKNGNSGLLVDSISAVGGVQGIDELVEASLKSGGVDVGRGDENL
jgi:hypothetical protein